MFIQNKNMKLPLATENYLGQLTREIEKGWEMELFIGLGSKNYAYRKRQISTGKVEDVMNIRGFTLNYRASKGIILEHFYDLVTKKTKNIFPK